jgi:hypothetical protein
MREIRTLRATWRGLETWNGRDTGRPARQSSTLLMIGDGRRGDAERPATAPILDSTTGLQARIIERPRLAFTGGNLYTSRDANGAQAHIVTPDNEEMTMIFSCEGHMVFPSGWRTIAPGSVAGRIITHPQT